MKKQIFIAGLLMVALCSCSNNAKSEAEQPTKTIAVFGVTTEATTEPITTAEITTEAEIPTTAITEPTTEPEVKEPIFNEQGIEVYYQDIDQNFINLYVVNPDKNNSILIYLSNISINGINFEKLYFEEHVPQIDNCTCHIEIPLDKLQAENITRINELKFDLSVRLNGDLIDRVIEYTVTR